jgi:AcrR family transcriptional regulator
MKGSGSGWETEAAGRREEIVEIASRLFAERSYRGVGIRAIAAQVGVQPASIYHHFGSKADILDAIIADVTERFISAHLWLLDSDLVTPSSMRQLIEEHVVYFWHHRYAETVGLRELKELSASRAEQVRRSRRSYQDAWIRAIETGISGGWLSVQNPRMAALGLLSMINGVNAWYREDGPLSIAEVAEMHAEMAVTGLLGGPSKPHVDSPRRG